MGELTGEKGAYWMNKFFAEGEMGRALDGSPAWMEKVGFSPTRHPMSPDANTDIGSRYEVLGVPIVGGQQVTPDTIREQNQTNQTLVPGVPGYADPSIKGKKLENRASAADAAAQGKQEVADKGEQIVRAATAATMERKGKSLGPGVRIVDPGLVGKVQDKTNDGKK
jgi:hypothetical protein